MMQKVPDHMAAARLKTIIKELVPPALWRVLRPAPPRPATPVSAKPAVHELQGGPLKGARLLVDTSKPAFGEMVSGTFDGPIWPALPAPPVDGLVLDIGAHIGYHALAFASTYPAAHVVAFEPNPANLERLRANLALNPALAARIGVEECALGDTNGTLQFSASDNVDDETSSGGYLHGITPPLDQAVYDRSGFRTTTVQVRRLDDLAREQHWGRVALMKIDVEGAEHLVLKGAEELLRRDRPCLCIEVHSVACMLAVDQILLPLGYTIRLLEGHSAGRAHIVAHCALGR